MSVGIHVSVLVVPRLHICNSTSPLCMKKISGTYVIGIVAVTVLVAAGAVAFGMMNVRADTRPHEAVERFYTAWIASQNLAGNTGAPYQDGLHENSTYVTSRFGSTMESLRDEKFDPVTCGYLPPQSFEIDQVQEQKNASGVTVVFYTNDSIGRVMMTRDEKGWWRIDEVDCIKKGNA